MKNSRREIYYIIQLTISLILIPFHFISQDTISGYTIPDLKDLLNTTIQTDVISASKIKQNIAEAPANIVVISRDEIENRGYRTIQELLKDLPGFDFATGQPSGEFPGNFLFRGISDVGQTKFVLMVDGIPLNDVSNGWIRNIGHNFTLTDVDRVELVSGAGSSLYGLNSFAGYINIITKETESGTHITSSNLRGTFSTTSSDIMVSHKFYNGFSFQLVGNYYSTKGEYGVDRYDPGNYFHNNYEPDSIFTNQYGVIANDTNLNGKTFQIPDGFNTEIDDYFIRGKLTNGKLTLNFSNWAKKEGLGSYINGYEYFTNTNGIDYTAHHKGSFIGLNYNTKMNDWLSSVTKTYYYNTSILPQTGFSYTYQFNDVTNSPFSPTILEKKTYQNKGFLIGILQQNNIKVSKTNELIAGVQIEYKVRTHLDINFYNTDSLDNVNSNTLKTFNNLFYSKNGAFFLQDQHKVTEYLNLTLGARLDIDELYGNSFNPKAAIVRHKTKGIGYKLLYERGYKAPSVFELYDEWRGNEKLLPERINTLQAIISYDWQNISINTSSFVNSLNNLIVVAPNTSSDIAIGPEGQKATIYQNIGNKVIVGGSINSKVRLTENLLLQLGYNFIADDKGKPVDNTSMHKLNFAINYLIYDKLNINIRGNYISKIKAPESNRYYYEKNVATIAEVGYDYNTESNPDGYLDGSFIFNCVLTGKNFVKNRRFLIEPQLVVKNIFNTAYAYMGRQTGDAVRPIDEIQSSILNPNGFIPAYHPQMGREVYIGIKIKFN